MVSGFAQIVEHKAESPFVSVTKSICECYKLLWAKLIHWVNLLLDLLYNSSVRMSITYTSHIIAGYSSNQMLTKCGEICLISWCRFHYIKTPLCYRITGLFVCACRSLVMESNKGNKLCQNLSFFLNILQRHGLGCIPAKVQVSYFISFFCNMICFITYPIQTERDEQISRQRHVQR